MLQYHFVVVDVFFTAMNSTRVTDIFKLENFFFKLLKNKQNQASSIILKAI